MVIFITLVSDFSFFSRLQIPAKTILVIHNGHSFFAPFQHLTFSSGGLRLLLFFLRREARQRRRLLANFDFLSLAAPSMVRYFSQQYPALQRQYHMIDPLPFAYFEGLPPDALEEKPTVEIAIPGTVKGEGRDYETVLAAFRQIVPDLQHPVKLHLLGRAQNTYAQKLVAAFRALEGPCFEVLAAEGIIPQRTFDEQLRKMDFLLLPLEKSYPLGGVREYYGHTNISGGLNDLLRFGIPTLITPHYPLEPALEQLCLRYTSSTDLAILLRQWIQEKSYLQLRQKAPEVLAAYRREVLGKQLDARITDLLSQ